MHDGQSLVSAIWLYNKNYVVLRKMFNNHEVTFWGGSMVVLVVEFAVNGIE